MPVSSYGDRHSIFVRKDDHGSVEHSRTPLSNPAQPQRFSFSGTKVQLHESLEGKVSIYYADTKLHPTGGEIYSGGEIFMGSLKCIFTLL